jgi:hypothetical protein
VYHEEWKSARLDQRLAQLTPDSVRSVPMASSTSGVPDSVRWVGIGALVGGLLIAGIGLASGDEEGPLYAVGGGIGVLGLLIIVYSLSFFE